jgi:hypothetical protein
MVARPGASRTLFLKVIFPSILELRPAMLEVSGEAPARRQAVGSEGHMAVTEQSEEETLTRRSMFDEPQDLEVVLDLQEAEAEGKPDRDSSLWLG